MRKIAKQREKLNTDIFYPQVIHKLWIKLCKSIVGKKLSGKDLEKYFQISLTEVAILYIIGTMSYFKKIYQPYIKIGCEGGAVR